MPASLLIRPLTLALVSTMVAGVGLQAQHIEGSYTLYESGSSTPVTTMSIHSQSGSGFSISGAGWSGSGSVQGGSGYYDWRFTDGKSGRTTFTVSADGALRGHVYGSGLDWHYVARRTSSPPAPQPSAGSCITLGERRIVDDFVYLAASNACGRAVQLSLCVRYVSSGNRVILGALVPARGRADVSLGHSSLGDVQVLAKEEDRAVRCD